MENITQRVAQILSAPEFNLGDNSYTGNDMLFRDFFVAYKENKEPNEQAQSVFNMIVKYFTLKHIQVNHTSDAEKCDLILNILVERQNPRDPAKTLVEQMFDRMDLEILENLDGIERNQGTLADNVLYIERQIEHRTEQAAQAVADAEQNGVDPDSPDMKAIELNISPDFGQNLLMGDKDEIFLEGVDFIFQPSVSEDGKFIMHCRIVDTSTFHGEPPHLETGIEHADAKDFAIKFISDYLVGGGRQRAVERSEDELFDSKVKNMTRQTDVKRQRKLSEDLRAELAIYEKGQRNFADEMRREQGNVKAATDASRSVAPVQYEKQN